MITSLENIPVKYSDLISEIETGQVKIPQFQRKFVWGIKASAKLLDSIIKGYPIGTFIYWRTNERLRAIRDLGNISLPEPKDGEYINYVLDGQQRLTSLFASLKGVQIKDEDGKVSDYSEMYINLLADDDDEIIVIDVSNMEENTYIRVTDLMEGSLTMLASFPRSNKGVRHLFSFLFVLFSPFLLFWVFLWASGTTPAVIFGLLFSSSLGRYRGRLPILGTNINPFTLGRWSTGGAVYSTPSPSF